MSINLNNVKAALQGDANIITTSEEHRMILKCFLKKIDNNKEEPSANKSNVLAFFNYMIQYVRTQKGSLSVKDQLQSLYACALFTRMCGSVKSWNTTVFGDLIKEPEIFYAWAEWAKTFRESASEYIDNNHEDFTYQCLKFQYQHVKLPV